MSINKYYLITFLLLIYKVGFSQEVQKQYSLHEAAITGYKAMNGIGRMKDVSNEIIYAGKKTEVLIIDSFDANKAINNTRQIIGRIPGANIIETESGGFTANGIGFRGLNPYQSIETNTRQNGYNISADIFGYNEAYYLPPMEAVKSITILRGASSLAFGPQIGGMINYELKNGSSKPIEVNSSQTFGNYGLFNSYNSIGGTLKKFKYFGFLQYRTLEGWRENSQQRQVSGFASLQYQASEKLTIGLEYSVLRNTIKMPGGLNDSLFNANPQQSLRSRNWLQSPWNVVAAKFNYKINNSASISLVSSYLHSQRDLVWRNEDGGPTEKDTITPDLNYIPREVEHEYFRNITNELRFIQKYKLGTKDQTLSLGMRHVYSYLKRQHGAEGTTGSDLDYTLTSPWGGEMEFNNTNIALFAENIFRINERFSIIPGIRYEYLNTKANGYDENETGDSSNPYVYANNEHSKRTFLLGGIALQYYVTSSSSIYANFSQSYRPVTYSELTPFGSIAHIDKNLKDASANNFDIGYRGSIYNILNFDVSLFYIDYSNKIGTVFIQDTITYPFRTNTGNAIHKGAETYFEINILDGLFKTKKYGKFSVYNSFAFIDAQYASGEYKGKIVEYAPKIIERAGLNYKLQGLSFNLQYAYTAKSYSDASNTEFASDGLSGIIPSYSLLDFSASYTLQNKIQFKLGVNNINDKKYFTMRTTEYPGPGIIPSNGRMIYAGISATF